MALDGGGGGPVGSANSFTGTAQSIEYADPFAYGYSGVADIDNNETTQLLFTTGNVLLRADFQFSSMTGDKEFTHKIYLNGTVVFQFNSYVGGGRRWLPAKIVIPAYTEVKCTSANVTNSATGSQSLAMVAEVVR
tara:strand:- start:167 stop:571 length:405 start_codon:yes stop_codon:yes gene_type:complete